jgi:hypothetical protein
METDVRRSIAVDVDFRKSDFHDFKVCFEFFSVSSETLTTMNEEELLAGRNTKNAKQRFTFSLNSDKPTPSKICFPKRLFNSLREG